MVLLSGYFNKKYHLVLLKSFEAKIDKTILIEEFNELLLVDLKHCY